MYSDMAATDSYTADAAKPVAIRVTGLSKAYKTYDSNSALLREVFTGRQGHRNHWALKNICFEIPKGEIVGVIGRNGSGKSTLLKIITGVLDATTGDVEVNGRISAILELGTGFHPDFTGRQNIITGGMCMGMSRAEVERKLPWIIEFSELESAIDTPFRTYSSGMQARLTFSTAVAVDPEILIVDEALAAGDAYFVAKCMRRIREICNSGATVLFVSHSTYAVIELCDTAIWIEDQRIRAKGPAYKVCKAYELQELERVNQIGLVGAKSFGQPENCPAPGNAEGQKAPAAEGRDERGDAASEAAGEIIGASLTDATYVAGNKSIAITSAWLENARGERKSVFETGEDIIVRGRWQGKVPEGEVAVGMRLDSDRLQAVSGYTSNEDGCFLNGGKPLEGEGGFTLRLMQPRLGASLYELTLSLKTVDFTGGDGTLLFLADRVLRFSVRRRKPFPHTYMCEIDVTMTDQ